MRSSRNTCFGGHYFGPYDNAKIFGLMLLPGVGSQVYFKDELFSSVPQRALYSFPEEGVATAPESCQFHGVMEGNSLGCPVVCHVSGEGARSGLTKRIQD